MGVFHFLNVKNGDCSIIQHATGNVTVIDVNNAKLDFSESTLPSLAKMLAETGGLQGNFNQKAYPVNPIKYMRDHGITDVLRFILTHPDMDHMDGLKDFFMAFRPANFWDTANKKEISFEGGPYREEDWLFYKSLRDGQSGSTPRRLTLHSGDHAQFWDRGTDGSVGGDGLTILAPTKQLVDDAVENDDYNDGGYVILYRSRNNRRILIAGDSHDATWEHIIENHHSDVANVDLLVAPHHGRHSDRSFRFLDVVQPKVTFFGNAPSEHLAYGPWYNRDLTVVTNNQADCMVVDTDETLMNFYVTNKAFADKRAMEKGYQTRYSPKHRAYFLGHVNDGIREAA